MDVIVAATSHSANCHLDAVIRAHDFCVAGCRDAQRRAGDAGASDFLESPAAKLFVQTYNLHRMPMRMRQICETVPASATDLAVALGAARQNSLSN